MNRKSGAVCIINPVDSGVLPASVDILNHIDHGFCKSVQMLTKSNTRIKKYAGLGSSTTEENETLKS